MRFICNIFGIFRFIILKKKYILAIYFIAFQAFSSTLFSMLPNIQSYNFYNWYDHEYNICDFNLTKFMKFSSNTKIIFHSDPIDFS